MMLLDTTLQVKLRSTSIISLDRIKDLIQQENEVRDITKVNVEYPFNGQMRSTTPSPHVNLDDLPEVKFLMKCADDLVGTKFDHKVVALRAAAIALRKIARSREQIIAG